MAINQGRRSVNTIKNNLVKPSVTRGMGYRLISIPFSTPITTTSFPESHKIPTTTTEQINTQKVNSDANVHNAIITRPQRKRKPPDRLIL